MARRGVGSLLQGGKDLGSRSAIDMTLKRYKEKGTIRKLARGLYDYPRVDPILGLMPPSSDDIVRALAGVMQRKFNRLVPMLRTC